MSFLVCESRLQLNWLGTNEVCQNSSNQVIHPLSMFWKRRNPILASLVNMCVLFNCQIYSSDYPSSETYLLQSDKIDSNHFPELALRRRASQVCALEDFLLSPEIQSFSLVAMANFWLAWLRNAKTGKAPFPSALYRVTIHLGANLPLTLIWS